MENLETLFIGGDTRYGLGKISRVDWKTKLSIWGRPVDLSKGDPIIEKSNVVWGHATHDDGMFGNKELLGGWDYSKRSSEDGGVLWTPGSHLKDKDTTCSWKLSDSGCWEFGTN